MMWDAVAGVGAPENLMAEHWRTVLQHQAIRLRPGPAAFAAFAALAFGIALLAELRQRAAIEDRNAAEIATEDDASCARLGAPPGTDRFAACAAELQAVRTRQQERITRTATWF